LDSEKPTPQEFEVQRLARARRERLLEHIRTSRGQFEREVQSRRRLLLSLQPPPDDPFLASIEAAWERLYDDYRRYRKAVPYPGERGWR